MEQLVITINVMQLTMHLSFMNVGLRGAANIVYLLYFFLKSWLKICY
jgi:hypothetical protein